MAASGESRRAASKPPPGRSAFAGCITARFSMLDIVVVRRDPDRVRRSAQRRGLDASFIDQVLQLDSEYRSALTAVESAKAEKNRLSGEIGKAADKAAAARELRPKIDELSQRIAAAEEDAKRLAPESPESPLRSLLENIPNIVDDSVPDGVDEGGNVVVRSWGTPAEFAFEPKPHWELGEALDIFDFERATNFREAVSPCSKASARGFRARSRSSFSIAPRQMGMSRSRRPI